MAANKSKDSSKSIPEKLYAKPGHQVLIDDIAGASVSVNRHRALDTSAYEAEKIAASFQHGDIRKMLDQGLLMTEEDTTQVVESTLATTPYNDADDRLRESIYRELESGVPQDRIAASYRIPIEKVQQFARERNVAADDLTEIPTINSVRARQLNNLGIWTFLELSRQKPEELSKRLGFVQAGVCRDWINAAREQNRRGGASPVREGD